MSAANPYAPPAAPAADARIQRLSRYYGGVLVTVPRLPAFPPVCLKCGTKTGVRTAEHEVGILPAKPPSRRRMLVLLIGVMFVTLGITAFAPVGAKANAARSAIWLLMTIAFIGGRIKLYLDVKARMSLPLCASCDAVWLRARPVVRLAFGFQIAALLAGSGLLIVQPFLPESANIPALLLLPGVGFCIVMIVLGVMRRMAPIFIAGQVLAGDKAVVLFGVAPMAAREIEEQGFAVDPTPRA